MDESQNQDICRVCRSEGSVDRPLFHPCICTGSIKFIHQDCLLQWMRYSKKEYCELCKHRISFAPIYSPDMPKRLPIGDILSGLARNMATAIRYWIHYTLVAVAWLAIVPLSACRIYRCLFTGSVSSVFLLPMNLMSSDDIIYDIFHGCFVVACTLCAFISLVWLREQILHGGGPDWLDQEPNNEAENGDNAVDFENDQPAAAANENFDEDLQVRNEINNPANEIPANNALGGNQNVANNNENDGADDEVNWNREWDRAAEELTWERLLGLDGSLVFLEHVFWVVSLNTMFVLVFAFFPYHIGRVVLLELNLESWVEATHFEGLLTSLCGYLLVGMILVFLHAFVGLVRMSGPKRIIGLFYIIVKVALLSVVEIGVFPLVAGWWMDLCSLALFDANLKSRAAILHDAPGTSMFIHWMVGMIYVFYFASLILLLREVLRPGVLWFLRNLNDPDFNPVQEMIHLPILRHMRRFLASMMILGSTVILMIWLPVRIIHYTWPTFLPYSITISSETPVYGLSFEFLLLQVFIPALFEQGHTRTWMKTLVKHWCVVVSKILGLRSYLLGDVLLETEEGEALIGVADDNLSSDEEFADDEIDLVEEDDNNNINNDNNNNQNDNYNQLNVNRNVNNAAINDNVYNAGIGIRNVDENVNGAVNPNINNEDVHNIYDDNVNIEVNGNNIDVREPEVQIENNQNNNIEENIAVVAQPILDGGLGAAHQALLQRDGPTGFNPYVRPRWFGIRIFCLVVLMCISLTVSSVVCLIVPIWVGRQVMQLVLGTIKIHELYSGSCGLYICLLCIRGITLVVSWFELGWNQVVARFKKWSVLIGKSVIALIIVAGVIPLFIGVLIELVIVIPIRVPLHQTPIIFIWEDWAHGVLYAKITCAVVLMGPNWWLRTNLEAIYLHGLRNLNLDLILRKTAFPVLICLTTCLALPYVAANSIAPFFASPSTLLLVDRHIYPGMLFTYIVALLIWTQIKQFTRLYEHIKNDKYLVGRRLVNYNHNRKTSSSIIKNKNVVSGGVQNSVVEEADQNVAGNGENQNFEDDIADRENRNFEVPADGNIIGVEDNIIGNNDENMVR